MYYPPSSSQLYNPTGVNYLSNAIKEKALTYIINETFEKISRQKFVDSGMKGRCIGYNEDNYKEKEKTYSMTRRGVNQLTKIFYTAEMALKDISVLQDNWNENGAKSFSRELVEKCYKILRQLTAEPFICPTACGSIQFEYEKENGEYLEFEIYEDRIEVFSISQKGEEQEETFLGKSAAERMKQMVVDFYG